MDPVTLKLAKNHTDEVADEHVFKMQYRDMFTHGRRYTATVESGSIDFRAADPNLVEMGTGVTANSSARVSVGYSTLVVPGIDGRTINFDVPWKASIYFTLIANTTNGVAGIRIGGNYNIDHDTIEFVRCGCGVVIRNNEIFIRTGDDTTGSELATGITINDTDTHHFGFAFYPGRGFEVFYDGVSIGEKTNHLPAGDGGLSSVFHMMCENNADTANMHVGVGYFILAYPNTEFI